MKYKPFVFITANPVARINPMLEKHLEDLMLKEACKIAGENVCDFTHTTVKQEPLKYEDLVKMRQELKASMEIQDEVEYIKQRSRLLNANGVFGAHKSPYNVDRQDLIDDDFSSLSMRRLTRYEPVRKPVVMYDELGRYHDHQWHTVKFSTHTESGFEDEYVEQCKICGVKKDANN